MRAPLVLGLLLLVGFGCSDDGSDTGDGSDTDTDTNADSGAYLWHTFYGGDYFEHVGGLAVDGVGNLYVAGESYHSWNGPNGQSPLNEYVDG